MSVNRNVSSRVRKVARDGVDVTSGGRQLHTRGPATENARLQTVERWTRGWTRQSLQEERSPRRLETKTMSRHSKQQRSQHKKEDKVQKPTGMCQNVFKLGKVDLWQTSVKPTGVQIQNIYTNKSVTWNHWHLLPLCSLSFLSIPFPSFFLLAFPFLSWLRPPTHFMYFNHRKSRMLIG